MEDVKAKVTHMKDRGNKCMESGELHEAHFHYTKALELDPVNHVLYSNRSATFIKMEKYNEALEDAEKVIELKPDWPKGYSRKGAALVLLKKLPQALETYLEGLHIDPANQQLKESVADVRRKLMEQGGGKMLNPFHNHNCIEQIKANPRISKYMEEPDFAVLMEEIVKHPRLLLEHLTDKRVMETMTVLMELEDSDDDEPWLSAAYKKNPTAKPKEEKMEVDKAPKESKAFKEKEAGNAAYKKKDFQTALQHYGKAIEIDPKEMTFLSNKAAVYFEMQDYKQCIATCEKAVEVGRENRADFKLIAKAFTRIGNAYKALKDFGKAKTFYEKSLSEHRTPDTKELLSKLEKVIKEQERLSYIDPAKAEVEKGKGNEFFRKGDYPSAIKHYSEAIRRNPEEAKIYSNRAACYTKLAEFSLGLKDCDECIRLQPDFIKGYIRKGKIHQGLKQFAKAQDSYQKALDIDANCQDALDGFRECMMAVHTDPEEVRKRAMADPEVQQILKDPAMRMILEQMQTDPRALQDHLKNPDVASKIQKLLQSGLISIR
ncbi:stress-induced-phosphoprotein 1-like isoform X1 [Homarus americanus]|uniref:stress-induced-phosphoprotein 1-like isoform X1 n=1 Tax=Homarus americanus TaxID=6706 RepID=UPI001C483458|nr:stress-induced-phosphoprotein 1-like isoform X1 [Homarus americanus]